MVVPNTVAHITQHGSPILFDLFAQQMDLITSNRSHVSVFATTSTPPTSNNLVTLMNQGKQQIYDNSCDIEAANDTLTIKIFHFIECLLLHASYLLKNNIRSQIETTIQQGLQCASNGLLIPMLSTDKRLRRVHFVERIRQSLDLLQALMQVATVDVMVASTNSSSNNSMSTVMSRNVGSLQALCVACTKLPISAKHNLVLEANKTLNILGNLLHPSALPMPYLTPADLVGKYIVQCNQDSTKISEPVHDHKQQQDEVISNVGSKRSLEQEAVVVTKEEEEQVSKKATLASETVLAATETTVSKPLTWDVKKPSTTTSTTNAAKRSSDSDDDDDDLPDIDINDD